MTRLLVAFLLTCAGECAQTYVIAGVVVHPDGHPAKRVHMALFPVDAPENPVTLLTGANGVFRFENLAPRKYHLTAQSASGAFQAFGQRSLSQDFSTDVATGPDFDTTNLVFRLIPLAAICGRVTDAEGEPVEGVQVQLFASSIFGGKRRVHRLNLASTDDRGEYRFGSLSDGVYYLAVSGAPWYAGRVRDSASKLAHDGYPTTYYPNTHDPRSAAPLILKPGKEAVADFALALMPAIALTIVPKTTVAEGVRLEIWAEGVAGSRGEPQSLFASGEQHAVLPGVQPGRYTIRASANGDKRLYGAASVMVGSADTSVDIVLTESPDVAGKLTMVDGSKIPEGAAVTLEDEAEDAHPAIAIAPDGSFHFDNVPPGDYRVLLGSSNQKCHLTGVTLNGTPAKPETIKISGNVDLQLSASLTGGELRGVVIRDGKPVPGVMAVLAPARESANPADFQAFETDTDGTFEWSALPPGDYLLIVKEDWFDWEYANPAALRPLRETARPVHIEGTETQKIRVEIP